MLMLGFVNIMLFAQCDKNWELAFCLLQVQLEIRNPTTRTQHKRHEVWSHWDRKRVLYLLWGIRRKNHWWRNTERNSSFAAHQVLGRGGDGQTRWAQKGRLMNKENQTLKVLSHFVQSLRKYVSKMCLIFAT